MFTPTTAYCILAGVILFVVVFHAVLAIKIGYDNQVKTNLDKFKKDSNK